MNLWHLASVRATREAKLAAFDDGDDVFSFGARVVGQQSTGLAGFEIDHHDRAEARIGDVRDIPRHIDSDIVQVTRLRRDGIIELDDPDGAIGGQVELHQLRPAGDDTREFGRGRIEHPKPIRGIDIHGLHADELR